MSRTPAMAVSSEQDDLVFWAVVLTVLVFGVGLAYRFTSSSSVSEQNIVENVQELAKAEHRGAFIAVVEKVRTDQGYDHSAATAAMKATLQQQGWEDVHTDAPDMDVVRLDPKALGGKEEEIHKQLASTMIHPTNVDGAKQIALMATKDETRHLVLEALERSPLTESKMALRELYEQWPDVGTRGMVLAKIHPKDWQDQDSQFLRSKLGDSGLKESEVTRALSQLAVTALSSGISPEQAAQSLEPRYRDEFLKRVQVLQTPGSAGSHNHQHHEGDHQRDSYSQ